MGPSTHYVQYNHIIGMMAMKIELPSISSDQWPSA